MTIGMLVESLTSKVGALNGHFVDATPFQKCENPNDFVNPIEEFGNRLEKAGFAKHGGELRTPAFTTAWLEHQLPWHVSTASQQAQRCCSMSQC